MKRNSNIKVYNSFKVNGNGINFFIPNDKELYKKVKKMDAGDAISFY